MPVKLIRSDTQEGKKVTLPVGTSILGRGTLLHVHDKRVSRKHAEVEVKDDSVIVKALHENPCFYIKKGSNESQTLNLNSTVVLSNADKIGLLPKSYWFEIIVIEDGEEQSTTTNMPEMSLNSQSTEINNDNTTTNSADVNDTFVGINNDDDTSTCSSSRNNNHILPFSSMTSSMNADCDQDPKSQDQQTADKSLTPKKISRTVSEETDELRNNDNTQSLENHNRSDTEDVKRIKVEPLDPNTQEEPDTSGINTSRSVAQRIKVEPTDNLQDAPSGSSAIPDSTSSANQNVPQNSVRERCYYGTRCYRRNPLHLVQYSHPRDSDWGSGEKGQCPFGARCVKTDPRHWDTHYHPPGTTQMPHLQGKIHKRRRSWTCDDSSSQDLVLNTKRKRKVIQTDTMGDSESESEPDPFGSDESDEWQPYDPFCSPDY